MASARQCTQARAQARVTSQITRNGARLKSGNATVDGVMTPGWSLFASLTMIGVICHQRQEKTRVYDRGHSWRRVRLLELRHDDWVRSLEGADDTTHDSTRTLD